MRVAGGARRGLPLPSERGRAGRGDGEGGDYPGSDCGPPCAGLSPPRPVGSRSRSVMEFEIMESDILEGLEDLG